MLESRASTEPVAAERAALLRKVAKLYAGPMQNPELAFVSASRALRELPDEEASLTLTVTLSERASQRRRGAGRAAGGDSSPGLGGHRPGRHPPRAGQGAGEARPARPRPSTPGGGCWRSCPPTPRPWARLVGLYQAAGRAPELLEIYQRQLAISEDAAVRAALLFQIAGLQDGALHDTVGAMATLAAPPRAQARRRPGAGAAGRCSARSRSAGRSWPTSSAGGWRCPAATWTSTSAPAWRWCARPGSSTSRRPRAVHPGARRPAEARRRPGAARGLGPARAPEQAAGGGAARGLPDRGRAGEARRAARAPGRRLAGPLRAQAAAGRAGRAARGGARSGRPLRCAGPRLPGGPERLRAPRRGSSRPRTRRAPTSRAGRSSTRRSCRASPRPRTPPQVLLELGTLNEQHLSNPARAIEVWSGRASWTTPPRSPRWRRWLASTGRPGGATGWSRAWTSWRS